MYETEKVFAFLLFAFTSILETNKLKYFFKDAFNNLDCIVVSIEIDKHMNKK